MDQDNLANLAQRCPPDHSHKLSLFLDFSERYRGHEVPDPYYGGPQGFDLVLNMVEDGALGLLADISAVSACPCLETPGYGHSLLGRIPCPTPGRD